MITSRHWSIPKLESLLSLSKLMRFHPSNLSGSYHWFVLRYMQWHLDCIASCRAMRRALKNQREVEHLEVGSPILLVLPLRCGCLHLSLHCCYPHFLYHWCCYHSPIHQYYHCDHVHLWFAPHQHCHSFSTYPPWRSLRLLVVA